MECGMQAFMKIDYAVNGTNVGRAPSGSKSSMLWVSRTLRVIVGNGAIGILGVGYVVTRKVVQMVTVGHILTDGLDAVRTLSGGLEAGDWPEDPIARD